MVNDSSQFAPSVYGSLDQKNTEVHRSRAKPKLRVIAEGVETQDRLASLQADDCGEGQWYYFTQPVVPQ
jgi:EAL domain-containing protein (putative c-di-GMP-specific phosphodiesterase class I)